MVKGGAAIFFDPANYPHPIQAAFQDKRFAVAFGLHPRHVASLTQEELALMLPVKHFCLEGGVAGLVLQFYWFNIFLGEAHAM